MEMPTSYGWFHFMMVGVTIALLVVYIVLWKKADEKTFRRIIFWTWIVLVVLETLKQLTYNFCYNEENPAASTFSYFWNGFPFQFCATPLYAYPFIVFIPNKGKVSSFFWESFVGFAACFASFGGVVCLVYPEQLFTELIFINIQSLLYHGLMFVTGVFICVWLGKRFNLKFVGKSPVVFLFFVALAMILNITFVKGGIVPEGTTFNMFFISPLFPSSLPVLDSIYPLVPYPVFLLLYIVGFTLVAFLFFEIAYWISWTIRKLQEKITNRKMVEQQ